MGCDMRLQEEKLLNRGRGSVNERKGEENGGLLCRSAGPGGRPLPMVTEGTDDPFLFPSRESAEEAATENILGSNYGFEVIEWSMPERQAHALRERET